MQTNNIITLTPAAIGHIKKVMSQHQNAVGFRLSLKQTGCSGYMYMPAVIETIKPDDIEIDIDEAFKVYLEPSCVDKIRGTEIDFVTKDLGMQQLQFNNPNATSLCGCGESFNLKDQ
jgi:iron-sulfur cluster assembly protein